MFDGITRSPVIKTRDNEIQFFSRAGQKRLRDLYNNSAERLLLPPHSVLLYPVLSRSVPFCPVLSRSVPICSSLLFPTLPHSSALFSVPLCSFLPRSALGVQKRNCMLFMCWRCYWIADARRYYADLQITFWNMTKKKERERKKSGIYGHQLHMSPLVRPTTRIASVE